MAAEKLKKDYVNIFAVGAGSNVNTKELEAIASGKDHVIRISSINALQSILSKMQSAICKGIYFLLIMQLITSILIFCVK